VDLALEKSFKLRETANATFRFEMFNVPAVKVVFVSGGLCLEDEVRFAGHRLKTWTAWGCTIL
jgi:hypothetical protein